MTTMPKPDYQARLRLAFDLYEASEAIMRQNLRRRNPEASDAEIEQLFAAWLRKRPGAEHGDGHGRPVPVESWPRR